MKLNFIPRTPIENFGQKVYNQLVENFSQTFFVGGMVRDLLLNKKIVDVDIATSATPAEVIKILAEAGVSFDDRHKRFGNVIAQHGNLVIEITTFRQDLLDSSRYNKIAFVASPKQDAKRRDFTINALYLSLKTGKILDFYSGLKDLKNAQLKFIGNPEARVKQDPLRIIRALRFALVLNFKLEKITAKAIKKHFYLIDTLTKTKVGKEILKISDTKKRSKLKKMIENKKLLDN